MTQDHPFTLGIEEEYLLVDRETGELTPTPDAMFEACRADLGERVSPEYLRCQVEIGTGICANITAARDELRELRGSIARNAAAFGLAPIAASCHPFANWRDQLHTDKERYNTLRHDLGAVVRRMLICGMHVHVGIANDAQRIDLMNQFSYFLPHLLALSGSSPFWLGEDTGLSSYRLTVFGNLPRTGLPPRLDGWGAFERSVSALADLGIIEDGSKIWWDLRPSSRFPTLETRICDANPRLETTLTIAALIQATSRMLMRLAQRNQRWRIYDNFLVSENRWRAIRYGTSEGLIDFGTRTIVPFDQLIEEWIETVAEDAEALGCLPEVEHARVIVREGNSADAQRQRHAAALAAGASPDAAMRAVVHSLIADFHHDL